jgi:hypothetical protein
MSPAEIASVMNANWQNKRNINSDDRAGAAALYP